MICSLFLKENNYDFFCVYKKKARPLLGKNVNCILKAIGDHTQKLSCQGKSLFGNCHFLFVVTDINCSNVKDQAAQTLKCCLVFETVSGRKSIYFTRQLILLFPFIHCVCPNSNIYILQKNLWKSWELGELFCHSASNLFPSIYQNIFSAYVRYQPGFLTAGFIDLLQSTIRLSSSMLNLLYVIIPATPSPFFLPSKTKAN